MSIEVNPELLKDAKKEALKKRTIKRSMLESIFVPVTKLDLFIFTSELKSTLMSGLEITRALAMMMDQTRKPILRDIIKGLLFNISQGKKISDSLGAYPWMFDPIYIASIKVGEENGRIPEILQSLEISLKKQIDIDRKVVGALVYPIIALIVCAVFTLITFKYIMPGIMEFVGGLDVQIPWPTQIVLALTKMADNPYSSLWFFLILAIVVFYTVRYVNMPRGKFFIDSVSLSIPVVRDVIRKLSYVNICRTLSTLVDAGVPITNAMKLAASACSNGIFSRSCINACEALENGETLSEFFKRDKFLYDPIFSSMFIVCEESGNMPEVTSCLADMYETDLENFFNSISSVIEPVMIVFVGSIIGFIILSVFLPLYSVFSEM